MINEIKQDAEDRMNKTLVSLDVAFARIRTGRAHASLLDGIMVNYYGSDTPLNQLANISVEDARTLVISPWEKQMIPDVEKAILKIHSYDLPAIYAVDVDEFYKPYGDWVNESLK